MADLEQAIIFATRKHQGQVDKAGQPYILHPLRIMLKMKTTEQQIVAVLHDILEDTDTTIVDLISLGFSQTTIDAVDLLTRRNGETRIDAALRAVQNPLARAVKLADVHDNMDINRIASPTARDYLRLKEYQQVEEILLGHF
ncbi:guanosine-3',5'-bis(diphosphate) 3'-pyrophosphohydrolase [Acinetobacter sp. MD2(2019)]|uniref:guanosine-3',5'-bis(diphosphate) 3'-pyrophosphohydrolase n=1 Tax=Acinetobacter sp. MD2(2019) TaxID=2605273 RepID=UPI002D1F0F78|nr:guanosine-3',5'-bis(diphosphate) 3'-pyrophosphohydrolase [Acinetobacter sp. MD2(2019)]MEB3752810.1 guanosine-3',5'-bis(diphosphate) 3'-pyrophosphohydrolase [Acinetobacter sp. MD2(2019)]